MKRRGPWLSTPRPVLYFSHLCHHHFPESNKRPHLFLFGHSTAFPERTSHPTSRVGIYQSIPNTQTAAHAIDNCKRPQSKGGNHPCDWYAEFTQRKITSLSGAMSYLDELPSFSNHIPVTGKSPWLTPGVPVVTDSRVAFPCRALYFLAMWDSPAGPLHGKWKAAGYEFTVLKAGQTWNYQ
jgi:hypothetical protein